MLNTASWGATWTTRPSDRAHDDVLLSAVVGHVSNLAVGPSFVRFVAADFHELGSLEAAGFVDQDLARDRLGIARLPCGKSRKDFLMSPKLQQLVSGSEITHDLCPDHSVVQATFHRLTMIPPKHVWNATSPFPWARIGRRA